MTKAALEASVGNFETLVQIFAIVVAIGIVGEVGFGIRLWILNKRLHAVQHAEDLNQEQAIAGFNKEASDARKDAALAIERAAKAEENLGSAKKDAALAEQHAAEANKVAEQERIERLKLEAKIQPRRLTSEQKQKLTSLLRPFSTAPIVLEWAGAGSDDITDLATDIFDAITSAGIKVPNKNILMGQYFKSVQLKIGSNRRAEAEVIATFLIEAGLASKPVQAQDDSNSDGMAIMIGSKP